MLYIDCYNVKTGYTLILQLDIDLFLCNMTIKIVLKKTAEGSIDSLTDGTGSKTDQPHRPNDL